MSALRGALNRRPLTEIIRSSTVADWLKDLLVHPGFLRTIYLYFQACVVSIWEWYK